MPKWQPCFIPFSKANLLAILLVMLFVAAVPSAIFGQTDEIQVYDANIAPPGIFNLMVHSNFTPQGRKEPAFPGAIVANHSFNGTWEWAYGVTPWLEQGLYMPVYSPYSKTPGQSGSGGKIDGFKVRELFVRPHEQNQKLFWGANFEFSFNYRYWESRTYTAEVRPIIGGYLGKWEIAYNPIVDTDYTGGPAGLEFNPAGRVVYNFNDTWDVAGEEYDGFGPFSNFASLHNQFHEVWGVFDRNGKTWSIEAGGGLGLTAGSDRWTLKFMISRDLNKMPWRPHL
jgi:hypothetical protein